MLGEKPKGVLRIAEQLEDPKVERLLEQTMTGLVDWEYAPSLHMSSLYTSAKE